MRAFVLGTLAAWAPPSEVDERPNIVLVMADDLGAEALSCYGASVHETPHLDALAASGIRFEQAHATPLCTPSRVQLMTGKYSFRNYDAFGFLRQGERTFANLLQDAGYDTCVVGKWQLRGNPHRRALSGREGSTPKQVGFERWCLWQLNDLGGSRFVDPVLSIDGFELEEQKGDYGPDAFCRYAQEFVSAERDGPFLLYYPMVLTHSPFLPTPGHPDYGTKGRSDPELFQANVEYMDEIIGRLVATLEETGQLENTVFLFLGDNGSDREVTTRTADGDVRGRKGYSVGTGTHVPLVAAWPGSIRAGRVSDDLVDLTDFVPTLLDLAGVERPKDFHTDGHSLAPTLLSGFASPREWVFCHYEPRWGRFKKQRWVHDRRFKLYDDGKLFDLKEDPREKTAIPPRKRSELANAATARFERVLDELRPPPDERPPNVVLILTDDQGSVDMGAYGADDLTTPGMDRLARRGVRFTQFYAAAPVCSPSRAALLTGKSPQAAGVPGNVSPVLGQRSGLPENEVTLAELLRDAGYRTALVGKWHLGHDPGLTPLGQGFDYWFGHLVGCIDNWSHFFFWSGPNRHDLFRNDEEIYEDGEYFPELMRSDARAFLRENRDRPFFLYFASNAPHYPYQADGNWLEDYRERDVPYPRDLYGAFLSSLDARIDKLLNDLDALGLTENTIVIFQSDHGHSTEVRAHGGGGSSGPYRGAKFSLFEGGVRVPAIVSWPGTLPEGEVRDQVGVASDWLPTVLELAGLAPAKHEISGKSLVPVLKDAGAASPHETVHWQRGKRWAVRKGNWKLLFEPHDTSAGSDRVPPLADEDRVFLVDLANDVGETTNLAAEHPDVVEELARLHEEWVARGHR